MSHDGLSRQEFLSIARWMESKLVDAFGLPFRALEIDSRGVWHIPDSPIVWDHMGITLFRPVVELEPKLGLFFAELKEQLSKQLIDWVVLVYEQRKHKGHWVCSAEPVALINRNGVSLFESRFVMDVEFVPDKQWDQTR